MASSSVVLRKYILSEELNKPVVFRGIHKNWEPLTWSLDDWGQVLTKDPGNEISVRCGQKLHEGVLWESECPKMKIDWKTLTRWDDDQKEIQYGRITNRDYWVYHDYKHMTTFLEDSYLKMFQWTKLGFPDRDGSKSTLWIGSKGSYTPCHFDTYGCNLVCQVFGRKKWILFPPEDTEALRPTRVPYEESSVYSQLNLLNPGKSDINALRCCRPVSITLEPGDVLFVPAKWWHFVQAEDFSISVNTWIELPQDVRTRLDEAVVRSVVACVISNVSAESVPVFLNPNETDVLDLDEFSINALLLQSANEITSKEPNTVEISPVPPKKLKVVEESRDCKEILSILKAEFPCIFELESYYFRSVPPSSAPQLLQSQLEKKPANSKAYLENLVNAITHPDIVKLISAQFLQNIRRQDSN